MGSSRWSFTWSSAAHLLLCGPAPNRPWTSTGPGVGDPWFRVLGRVYTQNLVFLFSDFPFFRILLSFSISSCCSGLQPGSYSQTDGEFSIGILSAHARLWMWLPCGPKHKNGNLTPCWVFCGEMVFIVVVVAGVFLFLFCFAEFIVICAGSNC